MQEEQDLKEEDVICIALSPVYMKTVSVEVALDLDPSLAKNLVSPLRLLVM